MIIDNNIRYRAVIIILIIILKITRYCVEINKRNNYRRSELLLFILSYYCVIKSRR